MSITSKLDSFKRKNNTGFTPQEIQSLISNHFSQLDVDDVFGILFGQTCIMGKDGEVVYFVWDVETAIRILLKKKK